MPKNLNPKKVRQDALRWVTKHSSKKGGYLPSTVFVSNCYAGHKLGSLTVEMLTTYGDLGYVGHVLNIPSLEEQFYEECFECEPIEVLDPEFISSKKKLKWRGIACDYCKAKGWYKGDFCDSCNGYGGFECESCDEGIVWSSDANDEFDWADLSPEVAEGPLYALYDEDGVPHAVWYEGPCSADGGFNCNGTRECMYCKDLKSKYVYRGEFCTKCMNSELCINCIKEGFNLHHVQVKNGKPIGVRLMKALLDYLERRWSMAADAGFKVGKVFIYTIDPKHPDREIAHPFTAKSRTKAVDRDSYLRRSKDLVDSMLDAMAR